MFVKLPDKIALMNLRRHFLGEGMDGFSSCKFFTPEKRGNIAAQSEWDEQTSLGNAQNSENIIMDRRSKMAQGAAPGQSKQAPDARRCSLCRYSWAALWQLSCRILYFHQIVFH